MKLPIHLGDGAYLDHDGHQFWLAANDHRNRVVALDAEAMANLVYGVFHFNVTLQGISWCESGAKWLENLASEIRAVANREQIEAALDKEVGDAIAVLVARGDASFDEAFAAARQAGCREFEWRHHRFHTRRADDPQERRPVIIDDGTDPYEDDDFDVVED